jgi:hypothetical protein
MRMTVLEFVRRAVALRSGNAWLVPEKGWRAHLLHDPDGALAHERERDPRGNGRPGARFMARRWGF